MACAYGKGDPPPELVIAWRCNQWNCLPEAGGYMDQDYVLMTRMTAFSNVHALMQKWQTLTGDAIHTLTESERKMLRNLKDLGIILQ